MSRRQHSISITRRSKTIHLEVALRSSTQWGTSHHIASCKWPDKSKSEINQGYFYNYQYIILLTWIFIFAHIYAKEGPYCTMSFDVSIYYHPVTLFQTSIKTKSNSKSSERVSIEHRDMFTFCTRWSKSVVHGNVKWFYENILVVVNSTTTYILTSQWMTLAQQSILCRTKLFASPFKYELVYDFPNSVHGKLQSFCVYVFRSFHS